MEKRDIKDLLLGRAVRFLEGQNIKFWVLLNKIDFIVESNIQYESYNFEKMEKELYKYLVEEYKIG